MPSVRVMSLGALAAALIAAPAYFTYGQPADPKPATTPAPTDGGRGGQPGQRGGQPGGRGGEGGGSVRQGMSVMNRGLRMLKSQVADASKKEENLKLVGDMERGCLAAKSLSPDKALNKAPDQAKKDEVSATYRKQLITMMEKLLKLETAVMDGKGEDATKLVGEIEALRDQSHGMMNVKD